MGTKFTYAVILTIVGAAFRLLFYFTGYETEKLAAGQNLQYIGLVGFIVVLVLGIRAVREEDPGKFMSYGRGVGSGVLISLFSGLMSAVYNVIHIKFINTQFADYQIDMLRTKWEQAGMGAKQIEQAEPMARMMMGPVPHAIATVVISVVMGTLVALIASIFLKRPAPEKAA